MRKLSTISLLALMSASLVACSNMRNRDSGTLVGGVAGALLGSQFGGGGGRIAATAVGAMAGAYIGNRIGQSMDDTDRMQANQALENNRVGQTSQWRNPDSGNQYSVTPTKTYAETVHHQKRYCREFTQDAIIAGKKQKIYGTACRQAHGDWKVQNKKH